MNVMAHPSPVSDGRFLSTGECEAIGKRLFTLGMDGGMTDLSIESEWMSSIRWARNRTQVASDIRNNRLSIVRTIRGATATALGNQISDSALEAMCRRAERELLYEPISLDADAQQELIEEHTRPEIWSDATYTLNAQEQADAMQSLSQLVEREGMVAAGTIQVLAQGRAFLKSTGTTLYYPSTQARYSVTVRDPDGTGSGWAGMDHHDWTQIDARGLTGRALDKCLRSRNPVAVEPGRYMAILEPQAVCGLLSYLVEIGLDRNIAESGGPFYRGKTRVRGGFFGEIGVSRLGERVIDKRLTIGADPMDPALGYAPFRYNLGVANPSLRLEVFHAADWIKDGVLQHLAYDKAYGVSNLGLNQGLPSSGAFHLRGSGPPVSIDEMIKTTKRAILVSRFSNVHVVDRSSALMTGFTRDGVWLVENGAISKPVKNFRFLESSVFVLNQVEQIGVPERVFHPSAPVVCPALKVRDFAFTQLVDAV